VFVKAECLVIQCDFQWGGAIPRAVVGKEWRQDSQPEITLQVIL